jgi:hypothetical protein
MGLLFGLFFARYRLRELMLVAYHLPYRLWRPYEALYDAAETKFTYEMVSDGSHKSHKDFLVDYRKHQPYAAACFKSSWDVFTRLIGRDYAAVVIVSLVLFWRDYWAFTIPFVSVQAGYFVYLHFYKEYRLYYHVVLMIRVLISERQRIVKKQVVHN